MDPTITVVLIAILIVSIIFHEVAHGLVAYWFGDHTAKDAGRLTLNPIPHIDPIGSILLPAILLFLGAPVLAWAKPVPINPYNFRKRRLAGFCVSIAGILTNFFLAATAAMALRWIPWDWRTIWPQIVATVVFVNLLLAVFNLFPIPPLDGSRLFITNWLPDDKAMQIEMMAPVCMVILFLLIPYLPVMPLVRWSFWFLTGFHV